MASAHVMTVAIVFRFVMVIRIVPVVKNVSMEDADLYAPQEVNVPKDKYV